MMNKHQVARILDRVALTATDRELRADAADLVNAIDNGAGGIQAKLSALLADAWARNARAVAAGTKRSAALKQVLALETALGMTPEPDTEPALETDVVVGGVTDTEPAAVADPDGFAYEATL